jgi:putative DNA double-strand break repair rad50 ATPase (fragment)
MEAKELQVVEFEIKNLTPAKIECNIEEVEIYMTAVKEKYHGWIVTEDGMDFAKKERTKLNKLEKTLSEERKRIQKEANANIEKLIEKLKAAEKDTKALSDNIKEQIDIFKEKEYQEKLKEIGKIKEKIFSENKLLEQWFTVNESWKKDKMTLKKIEEEIKEQFEYWNKRHNFITSQLTAINEEIENKISFEDVQYLMVAEYDSIMKKLVEKKNEIKTTEENMKKKAEEEKQRALEEAERKKQQELAELKRKKEQEKLEAMAKAAEEKVPDSKSENTDKKGTYICIKVSGLSKEATEDLLSVIKKHNLKYEKKEGSEING